MPTPTISKEQVVEVLKTVYDPEIPVDIYELGLVYDIEIEPEGKVAIKMTLTAVGCPIGPHVAEEIRQKLQAIGAADVVVNFVWSPPWSAERLTDDGRLALQSMGYPV